MTPTLASTRIPCLRVGASFAVASSWTIASDIGSQRPSGSGQEFNAGRSPSWPICATPFEMESARPDAWRHLDRAHVALQRLRRGAVPVAPTCLCVGSAATLRALAPALLTATSAVDSEAVHDDRNVIIRCRSGRPMGNGYRAPAPAQETLPQIRPSAGSRLRRPIRAMPEPKRCPLPLPGEQRSNGIAEEVGHYLAFLEWAVLGSNQ